MDNVRADTAHQSPIPPPRTSRRLMKVLRAAKGGAQLRGICLNEALTPQWSHWDHLLSGKLRCSTQDDCRFCPYLGKPRWYAYMPVFVPSTGRLAVIELTLEASRECPQLNGTPVPLRGKELTTWRLGVGKFGQCRAQVQEFRQMALPPQEHMPFLFDMLFGPDEFAFDPKLHRRTPKGGQDNG